MTLRASMRVPRDGFDVELELEAPAGTTVLLGPSGSGKSTVLDVVGGRIRAPRAFVSLGEDILCDSERGVFVPTHLRGIPRVWQDGRLFPHLDVQQNLLFGRREGEGPGLDEVAAALEIDGLLDRVPAKLSGGQRQRVALGRALLAAPRALLLDEPLANLDGPLRRRLWPHLRSWQQRLGVPFVLVTHDEAEAEALADQVLRIERGKRV